MWVGFLYTLVARVLSGFQITSTSRKASWASDSLSAVNWIVASIVLMWRWKSSMWWALRAQQTSKIDVKDDNDKACCALKPTTLTTSFLRILELCSYTNA